MTRSVVAAAGVLGAFTGVGRDPGGTMGVHYGGDLVDNVAAAGLAGILVDLDAVTFGTAAAGRPWEHYEVGRGSAPSCSA